LAANSAFASAFVAAGQGLPTGGTTGQVLAKTSGTDYASGWIWGRSMPRPPVAGLCLPRLNLGSSNNGGPCGGYEEMRADYMAVSRACTLGKISINIWTQSVTAGTVIRLGIYGVATDGRPGSLLADLGTVDVTTSTGIKTIDFTGTPVSITQDGFYFAHVWQAQNSTFSLRAYVGGGAGGEIGYIFQQPDGNTAVATVQARNLFVANVSGALPSNPTWSYGSATNIPVHAFEVVSVP